MTDLQSLASRLSDWELCVTLEGTVDRESAWGRALTREWDLRRRVRHADDCAGRDADRCSCGLYSFDVV